MSNILLYSISSQYNALLTTEGSPVKQNCRKQNLVITGVPELNEDEDDVNQAECFFVKTCEQYLSVKPIPLHHGTKRLGKKKTNDNRPRRLLIRLQSEECVTAVLSAAKNLRFSDDEYIRNSVYITADLSPTEAKQAISEEETAT